MRPPRLFAAGAFLLVLFLALTASARQLPDYMKHWEFSVDVEEDDGPNYFADLILPLSDPSPEAQQWVFLEPRLQYADDNYLLNTGAGYRRLAFARTWLIGGNLFHDYATEHRHYRVGFGLEALSQFAELRANSYFGASPRRLLENNSSIRTYEKAVDGFDLEAGMPVPYYSRLKLYGGYAWYDYERFKNRYGWTLRAEYAPVPYLVIDGRVGNDTKSNLDWGMVVALRIPFGQDGAPALRSPLRLDETAFPESDAAALRYLLVERHHDIVVERYKEEPAPPGTITVEVRRGT